MNKSRGFTLIELLVVISIISLLSSIVFSSIDTARAKARDTRRSLDIQQLNNAIQLYILDHNVAPPTTHTFSSDNPSWPQSFVTALSPYLSKLPTDPCPNCSSYGTLKHDAPVLTYIYRRLDDWWSQCRAEHVTCDKTGYILDVSGFETFTFPRPYVYLFGNTPYEE